MRDAYTCTGKMLHTTNTLHNALKLTALKTVKTLKYVTSIDNHRRSCTSILRPSTTVPCSFSRARSASAALANVTNPKPYMQRQENVYIYKWVAYGTCIFICIRTRDIIKLNNYYIVLSPIQHVNQSKNHSSATSVIVDTAYTQLYFTHISTCTYLPANNSVNFIQNSRHLMHSR